MKYRNRMNRAWPTPLGKRIGIERPHFFSKISKDKKMNSHIQYNECSRIVFIKKSLLRGIILSK
jgi:hypothetical protein